MLKAGQVTAPVKTDSGYHLIEKVAPAVKVGFSLKQEKARLQAEVAASKKANVFSDTVNSLNDMVVSSDALDVVGQEVKGVQVQSIEWLNISIATSSIK